MEFEVFKEITHFITCPASLDPGSQLIKCVGEEESLVTTALRFKPDPRHSLGSRFTVLSRITHGWMTSYPVKSA